MHSLFEEETAHSVISRLQKLNEGHKPLWGKMNPAQMMSHCCITMEVARDQKHIKRIPASYFIGFMMKKGFFNEKPVPKNTPTHTLFIRTDDAGIEKERAELIHHIEAFQKGGKDKCTTQPHAFFGKITQDQWAIGMYKHLDHHLKQFGV